MPIISSKSATGGPGSQVLICSQVLSGTATAFDTNTILGGNIPGTYTHLRVVLMGRGDTAANAITANFTFNNDTGANYDLEYRVNKGTTPSDVSTNASTSFAFSGIAAASDTAGSPGSMVVDIPCYAATTFRKQAIVASWYKNTADGTAGLYTDIVGGGEWRNTAAITRIAVTASAGNFIAGTSFYLYGIL